ncbi:ParB/RepB/Spo0J family partition protein [Janibacter corallicola]|uniref:ParB/RepB/Spo0J family partition protein n=1 Tax=Janibacter corallicola TaxID=415212 RepID=UPI00082F4646|nr:ParB/RepB/Spo0J family partition protein [Janibacter corallicola]
MSEKRRGLGRGLGALIPDSGASAGMRAERPVDVWFREREESEPVPNTAAGKVAGDAASATPPTVGGAGVSDEGSERTSPPAASDTTDEGGDAPGGVEESWPTAAEQAPAPAAEAVGEEAAGEELAPVPGASFAEVPLDAIRPNPKQPRGVFDEDAMAELAHSISEIGVLQPVVVRRVAPSDGVEYELIMGERRWRASREAGRDTVPAIIKDTDEDDLLRDALLENLHRTDLNPLEEAAAYQQLLDDFGCSQAELSGRIGRSRPQISNMLRLLRLPPMVARRVAAGVLSAGHARALLGLEDAAQMERLAQRIVAEGLSVRSVEEIVTLGMEPEAQKGTSPRSARERDPQLDELAGRISDRLDTRVKIDLGKRKGKMTIEFASREDLHRVLGQLGVDHAED